MAAHSVAPIFLRFALALTFLWAGWGKVLETMPVSGERAAVLASMGVLTESSLPSSSPAQLNPAALLPDPQPLEHRVRRVYGIALLIHKSANPAPMLASADSITVSPADPTATTAPATVSQPMALWPSRLASGKLPLYFAWSAAVSEIVFGLFVLVGLLTRISAAVLASTMVVAIWLTEIGPAIQTGNTVLGFIPAYGAFAYDAAGKFMFASLLWQISLLCSGLALMLTGPGIISFDRALFPPRAKSQELD